MADAAADTRCRSAMSSNKPRVIIEEVPDDEPVAASATVSEAIVVEPDDDDAQANEDKRKDGEEGDDDDEEEYEDDGNEDGDAYYEESDDDEDDGSFDDSFDDDDDFWSFASFGSMLGGWLGFGKAKKSKSKDKNKKKDKKKKDKKGQYVYQQRVVVSSSGGDGKVHVREKTTSERQLGDQVAERQCRVRDSDTGVDRCTVTRRLGGRQRVVECERDSSGKLRRKELLRGVKRSERDAFDREFAEQEARLCGTTSSTSTSRKALPPLQKRRRVQKLIANTESEGEDNENKDEEKENKDKESNEEENGTPAGGEEGQEAD